MLLEHYAIIKIILFSCTLYVCGDNVTFLILGDWGDTALPGQQQVANQMGIWADAHGADFIVSAGDNFYPWGVSSVDDRQFDNKWRNVYTHPAIANLTWYLAVGNHDYGRDNGAEWNQVEFSYIEPRWVMPNLWHSFYVDIPDSDKSSHIIVIDSECIGKQVNNYTVMLEWLEQELASSSGDWRIVVGHRPIYSVGDYGPWSGTLEAEIQPLLERYDAHMYICGHDHNMQHLHHENETDIEYIIAGAGGALWYAYDSEAAEILEEERGIIAEIFERTWGFVAMTLSEDKFYFEFVDNDGIVFYTYSREIW